MTFLVGKIGIWTGAVLGAFYCACLYVAQLWLICRIDGKAGLFYNAILGVSSVGEKEMTYVFFFLLTVILGAIAGGVAGNANAYWQEDMKSYALKTMKRCGIIGTILMCFVVYRSLQLPFLNTNFPWFAPQAMCAFFNPLTLFSGLLLFALRQKQRLSLHRS